MNEGIIEALRHQSRVPMDISSKTQHEIDLAKVRLQLLELWQQNHSKRALGGRWAMAGFALQSHLFLLRFFQGIASGKAEPATLAEMEGLSDILDPHDNVLTLVQVKRTLNKSRLIEAMEEAYLLTDLCQKQLPAALHSIRFQIVCRSRTTNLAPVQIDSSEILKGAADPRIWSLMLARFHSEPIVEHTDHSDRLHLLLWNQGLRNPKALVDKSLGRLLDAFYTPSNENANRLARELNEFYQEAPRHEAWRALGNLLDICDVTEEPEAQQGEGVLVDPRVTFEHVRKGYVRQRPQVFAELWQAFLTWLENLNSNNENIQDKIPVFWIAGRSGDGKSVLLLQLIQRLLHEHPDLPIIHLPSGNRFANFLEDAPVSEHAPVFTLIDDLYDLADRPAWDEKIRESLRLATPAVAVITCGPTEQQDQFKNNLADVFMVYTYSTPHITEEELNEFLHWFEVRTGKKRDRHEMTTDNALLVQVIFELAQGERMVTFARKFRRRLEKLGLFEAACAAIAVNSLYQDAPIELLGDEGQREALERLCAADQLHFVITKDVNGNATGIRIAHAHLSWLLFSEWGDGIATLRQRWARELAKSIQCHLNYERWTLANSLIQQLLTTPRLASGTNDELDRCSTISELYRLHLNVNKGELHRKTLGGWLNVLYRFPELQLIPDPIAIAARLLRDEQYSTHVHGSVAAWVWRLATINANDERGELRDAAEWFFRNRAGNSGIAYALASLSGHKEEPRIPPLIEDWLSANCCMPDAHYLLNAWIPKSLNLETINQQSLRWLAENNKHPQGYHVIGPLVTRNNGEAEVANAAKHWLTENTENPWAYHVIATLVAHRGDEPEVAAIAKRWLADNPHHPRVNQILAPLAARRGSDQDVFEAVMKWLGENPQHASFQDVISPLASARPDKSLIIDHGWSWLLDNPNHPGYRIVLGAIVVNCGGDPKIIALAESYLERSSVRQREQIIGALLYSDHAAPRHVNRALAYIETPEGKARKKVVLYRLGIALVHHPNRLLECLNGIDNIQRKRLLCYSAACGLARYQGRASNFLSEVMPSLNAELAEVLLSTTIKHKTAPHAIAKHVARWLTTNFRTPGYADMLEALADHEPVAIRILAAEKLSRSILEDLVDIVSRKNVVPKSLFGIFLACAQPRKPVECQAWRRVVAVLRQGATTPQATGCRGCPAGSNEKGALRCCAACAGGHPERRAAPYTASLLVRTRMSKRYRTGSKPVANSNERAG